MDQTTESKRVLLLLDKAEFENRLRGVSVFFYLIGGLTLFSCFISLFTKTNLTTPLNHDDDFARKLAVYFETGVTAALGVVYIILAYLVSKGSHRAFIIGFVLYSLDLIAMLFVAFTAVASIFAIVIKGFILFKLYAYFKVFRELKKINEELEAEEKLL